MTAVQEDWYTALRSTMSGIESQLTRCQHRRDPRIVAAMRHAVQALTDVGTAVVVVETELEIAEYERRIKANRKLLEGLGGQAQ